ncbi:MAG: hypothetical protein M3393_02840 [Actinomycetota bacterium]|nr:hypothetical protein [Actinomycetota bacterium]
MSLPAQAGRDYSSALSWALRLLTVAGLAVDAIVHLRLAAGYQVAYPDGVGGGNLFRLEAVGAIVAGIYVLLRGSRASYVLAFLVALVALLAVILTRYVELPSLGPFPWMYEPVWFLEKTVSAVAEGVAALAAAGGIAITGGRRGSSAG